MTSAQRIWMTAKEYVGLQEDLVAEPGMVLTIRYDGTGETETFLLGRRGAEGADIKVYSMASPLGRAIAGARPGEQRIYSIPNDGGRLVTLLDAVPYALPRDERIVSDQCATHVDYAASL